MYTNDNTPWTNREEYEVQLLLGNKVALAYAWIDAYAIQLDARVVASSARHEEGYGYPLEGITTEEMISLGESRVGHEDFWGGEYLVRGGVFEGESTDPLYWDHLATLLGVEIPDKERGSFFSCSC